MDPDVLLVVEIVGSLFGLVIVGGTAGYLAYTAVQVVRRRFLGEGLAGEEELEELRHRMSELEEQVHLAPDHQLTARVAELEERLDFAERLLSSEDNRARLPEPTDEVSSESARQ